MCTNIRNIHICAATDMSSYQSRKEGDARNKERKERRGRRGGEEGKGKG
jgi:hypothetical protein